MFVPLLVTTRFLMTSCCVMEGRGQGVDPWPPLSSCASPASQRKPSVLSHNKDSEPLTHLVVSHLCASPSPLVSPAVEAVVEFNYEAQQDDELSLTVGDIIVNIRQDDGGWWEGELGGRRGLFPDNFVRVSDQKHLAAVGPSFLTFSQHPQQEVR